MARLAGRHGHFFPKKLLQSQLADLEMPAPAEGVLVVPAAGTAAEMADKIIDGLGLSPQPPGTPHPADPAPGAPHGPAPG
jgi:gluconokinase